MTYTIQDGALLAAETYRAIAARGGIWLDLVTPGWWGSVDPETLDSGGNCVIKQVYGPGSWAAIWKFLVGVTDADEEVDEQRFNAAREFMASHGFDLANIEEVWQHAWTEEINRRLFAELQEQREDPGILRVMHST